MSYLATNKKVSALTQCQALNAIVFLYKHVLDITVSENLDTIRARQNVHPHVGMKKNE